jgi:AraC-like DNA-binding protein
MKFHGHLRLDEMTLAPSAEWAAQFPGWCFLRMQEGQGYWLGSEGAVEAGPGDVLVLSPLRDGLFRASQLGSVTLQYFRFCPELLAGFLTLAERRCLETHAANVKHACQRLPASHPTAQEFARACEEAGSNNGLLVRCRALQVATSLFEKDLQHPPARSGSFLPASKRILLFLSQLTEAEIMDLSAIDLATRCGCSVRHFNRLFTANFGMSLRSKQTELRLLKARNMLSETTVTITSVAHACGYRRLGLFNAMFKKRFGMTPTDWRGGTVPRPRPSARTGSSRFVTEK